MQVKPDVKALLVGSDDYPAWRTAYVRAVMGVGPVPQLPAVLPLSAMVIRKSALPYSEQIEGCIRDMLDGEDA